MHSVSQRCYARIGLVGNPSDGYAGKTLSVICKNFYADVTLNQSDRLIIEPDQYRFDSVGDLQNLVAADGYYGASRIFKATVKVFSDYVAAYLPAADLSTNFTISYKTNIPRMVGLAGSSALVVATLKALMAFHSIKIDLRILPSIALQVERSELNIGGGLQDRVIQFYEGLVLMNFADCETVDGYQCGHYSQLDADLLPSIYLAYSDKGAEPTEVFHNDLRARYDAGESSVVAAMQSLIQLTDHALVALENGNHEAFSQLMDENFNIRRSVSQLNPYHIKMIESARSCGASAKYAGSGGAIVGAYRNESQFAELQQCLGAIGCEVIKPVFV